MRIVIDRDKEVNKLKEMLDTLIDKKDLQSVRFAINILENIDGILLPEEYGRLGDLDALETLMRYEVLKHDLNEYGCLGLVSCAPTIIGESDAE